MGTISVQVIMDDTTTIRIFDKLDTISVDVGVIKATMIDRESLTSAIPCIHCMDMLLPT